MKRREFLKKAGIGAAAAVTATAHTTEAAAEGMSAFVEGREPKWP